jgi:hypothetical protein
LERRTKERVVRFFGRLLGGLWASIETAGGLVFILPRVLLCPDGVSVHACDDILAFLIGQSLLPEIQQMVGLYLE